VPGYARDYAYSVALGLAGMAAIYALPGAQPSSDLIVLPMALALMVGLLLTVRLTPDRLPSALVLLPAMAVDSRLGLAALPALAYAAILVNLWRGPRGPRVVSGASHLVLAFAAAHLCTLIVPVVPAWIVFAIVFVSARQALWHVALRLDPTPIDPSTERPDVFLSLPLAPIGLLPLAAGEHLGDGALLLTTTALLVLLFGVREAANLATARTEMEAQRDKLRRANALQDDLINLLTHEVRNPLTLVLSYAQMARRATLDKNYDQLPTYIGYVERAGRSIQGLMDNLLQLTRLEGTDQLPIVEPVSVYGIVNQVVADLAPLAKQKQQTLRVEDMRDVEPALTVPLLLREALSNLISNAVKYTPESGDISVWAETGQEPHTVVLGVRDTGIGLSLEDQGKLFTKFFRSDDPRVQRERGSGLGLAVTHALVGRIGGKITVESVPDHGTTFRLTLPSAQPG